MNIACYIRSAAVLDKVRAALLQAGFGSDHFSSDSALLQSLRRRSFNLILVDISVRPSKNDSIFSWLNCRSTDTTPVVILSAVHDVDMLALALDSGADDFITRPFETIELIARIRALLRRHNHRNTRRSITLGGFSLDWEKSKCSYLEESIALTPREFGMAWLFFSSPGMYISRITLGTSLWGISSDIAGRTIEQHVYKLRKKLQLGPERGAMIRTAYNQGYRLEVLDTYAQSKD